MALPRRRLRLRAAPATATGAAALAACTRAAWRAARTQPDAAPPARRGAAAAMRPAPGATRRGRQLRERRGRHALPVPLARLRTRQLAPHRTTAFARTALQQLLQPRRRRPTRPQRQEQGRQRGQRKGDEGPHRQQQPCRSACVAGRGGEWVSGMCPLRRRLRSVHADGAQALQQPLPPPPPALLGARRHRRHAKLQPARARLARDAAALRLQVWKRLRPTVRGRGARAARRGAPAAPRTRPQLC